MPRLGHAPDRLVQHGRFFPGEQNLAVFFLNLLDGRLPAKQFGAPFLDFLNQRVEGLLCFGELRLLWWQGNQQAGGVALDHGDALEN